MRCKALPNKTLAPPATCPKKRKGGHVNDQTSLPLPTHSGKGCHASNGLAAVVGSFAFSWLIVPCSDSDPFCYGFGLGLSEVREIGIAGSLYGMLLNSIFMHCQRRHLSQQTSLWPRYSGEVCRVADPEGCWQVTRRREFLGAGPPASPQYKFSRSAFDAQCIFQEMKAGGGVSFTVV